MGRIRVAIAGVGNCASALVQGIEYYRGRNAAAEAGLMHEEIGGFNPSDVDVVAALDIDRRKVGRALEDAVFAAPNCTRRFQPEFPPSGVRVRMSPVLDGVADHMEGYDDAEAFRVSGDAPLEIELRLSVQDSPNSAGVVIDTLRCAKLGLERGIAGPLEAPSAYFMKSPPRQMRDDAARRELDRFIREGRAEPDAGGGARPGGHHPRQPLARSTP